MVLTLSNEKTGTPTSPTKWSNEEQTNDPVPYKEKFLKEIQTAIVGYGKEGLRLCCKDTIGNAQHYHLNYLTYLEKCWSDHLGVVVTPDIVWYTLLAELAIIIKKDPETFRQLFSKSDKKEEILVFSGDPVEMPLDILTDALKNRVPIDTENVFPEFSTRTPKSLHAFQAAFCDMCSPYYNYGMMLCNIPKINVRGTIDDWKNLSDKWKTLSKTIIGSTKWTKVVSKTLDSLVENFQNKEFWKGIFSLERCGSGHQTEVLGWFKDFFSFQPSMRYVKNYSPHISVVKYKQINFNQDFEMSVGLFGSKKEDDFMVPDFSFVINEVLQHAAPLPKREPEIIVIRMP